MSTSRNLRNNKTKIKNKSDYPYLIVKRSNKNLICQLVDPISGNTVFTYTTSTISKGTKTEKAVAVGQKVASRIKELKIDRVIYNRNGYEFKGRVKALAESIKNENVIL